MQQQQGNPNQQLMQEPPKVITTKDHLYIKDMLSWNLDAMKKAHHFAQLCQDQEVKAAIDQAGQMHQRHYEKIISHLQNPQQQMMPQMQQQKSQQQNQQQMQ